MGIAFAIAGLCLGFMLLVMGWRGRRVGDHPYCSTCGFDLFGLPVESVRCSECGADTERADARRIGQRVRRQRPLFAGIALLLPAGGYLVLMAAAVIGGASLTPYKPVWWLASDATSSVSSLRTVAIAELTRRLKAGQISPADGDRIAVSLLSLQSSPTNAWYPECGQLLYDIDRLVKLPPERRKQYGANAAPKLLLTVRPRVRMGDPIAYQIKTPASRVEDRSRLVDRVTDIELRLGPISLKYAGGGCGNISNSGISWSTNAVRPEDYADKLQPGLQRLTIIQKREVRTGFYPSDSTLFSETVKLEADFELLPADQPTVTLINDPGLQPAIARCITPRVNPDNSGGGGMKVISEIQGSPVGIAFRVSIIAGKTRENAGSLALAAKGKMSFQFGPIAAWPSGQQTVSILYEPDIDAAIRTVDVFEMFNHPIQFDNVKITPW